MINAAFQNNVARLLDASRRFAVLAALLGVALHMDMAASDSLAPKAFWFCVAGALLPAFSALRLWWGERLNLAPPKAAVAVLAFGGAGTVAYLASPLHSVSQGAWQALVLSALLFFAAVDLLADPKSQRWLLRSLSVSALLGGLWCLAQRLGMDASAVGAATRQAFGSRVAGGYGNPNFAGGAFALLLPLLVHQSWRAEGAPWRWAARAAGAAAAVGLLLCASKAALFGAGAAVAVGAHLVFWSDAGPAAKAHVLKGLGAAALVALVVGGLLVPRDSLQRLIGGPGAWVESVSFRRITWAGSLDMMMARPLLGWGPGTFSVAYPAYRRPEAMAGQVQHAYEVTAPENWVLQVGVEAGLLGLLAAAYLLWRLLMPLRLASRAWATSPESAGLSLAILSGLAGSLACNLGSLDLFLPSTLLPFILLAALGVVLTAERAPAITLNPENYARLLVSFGLALLASVPLVQGRLQWEGQRQLQKAKELSLQGKFSEAIPRYQMAVDMEPGLLEARYFLGCSLQDRGQGDDLAKAEAAFKELRQWAPDYVLVHERLGRLYASQGRPAEAILAYERQVRLDPWYKPAAQALASLYVGQGRLDDVERLLTDAAARWPQEPDWARNLEAVRQGKLRKERR